MSDEIKVNRPPMHSSRPEEGRMYREDRGMNWTPWIVLIVVLLIVVGAAALFRDKLFATKKSGTEVTTKPASASGYQAVFLTNGQVYFGKLADVDSTYVTLTDIFYLQVTQPGLQGSQQQQQAQTQQQPQLSLVKLGNELHGPVDEMKINRDQILFYEDMKTDGKVYQAMKEYKANPQGATQNPPASQQQTTPPPAAVTPPPAPAR